MYHYEIFLLVNIVVSVCEFIIFGWFIRVFSIVL